MPIYEYACQGCGHRFEVRHAPEGPAPEGCPRCGGGVKKVLSPVGIIFRGSGWHVTDYGAHGPRSKDASEKPEAPPESAGKDEPAATSSPRAPD